MFHGNSRQQCVQDANMTWHDHPNQLILTTGTFQFMGCHMVTPDLTCFQSRSVKTTSFFMGFG